MCARSVTAFLAPPRRQRPGQGPRSPHPKAGPCQIFKSSPSVRHLWACYVYLIFPWLYSYFTSSLGCLVFRRKGPVNLTNQPSDLPAANLQTKGKARAEVKMARLRVIFGTYTGCHMEPISVTCRWPWNVAPYCVRGFMPFRFVVTSLFPLAVRSLYDLGILQEKFPAVCIPSDISSAANALFFFKSFSTSSNYYLFLVFPTDLFPIAMFLNTFFAVLSSDIPSTCPNHSNLPSFWENTCSLYTSIGACLVRILHTPLLLGQIFFSIHNFYNISWNMWSRFWSTLYFLTAR
jgi:hypothetical protein